MRQQPLFAELVGPAGAGKSTLFEGLARLDSVLPHRPFGVRQLEYVPSVLLFGALSLPLLFRQLANDRRYSWEETKKLIYLRGGRRFLRRSAPGEQAVVLLDQGPLFELARLREFGPEVLKPERIPRWWDRTLDRWSEILDMVIILDADDEILLQRIADRDVWHLTKEMAPAESRRFLRHYRAAYGELATQLRSRGACAVLEIDTGAKRPRETLAIARTALDELRSRSSQRRQPPSSTGRVQ